MQHCVCSRDTMSSNSSELFRWELRIKLERISMSCVQVSSQACFDSMAITLLLFCATALKVDASVLKAFNVPVTADRLRLC